VPAITTARPKRRPLPPPWCSTSSPRTAPIDFLEGLDQGAGLAPTSLYEDQLARRLAK
jgi:hypothetical protein